MYLKFLEECFLQSKTYNDSTIFVQNNYTFSHFILKSNQEADNNSLYYRFIFVIQKKVNKQMPFPHYHTLCDECSNGWMRAWSAEWEMCIESQLTQVKVSLFADLFFVVHHTHTIQCIAMVFFFVHQIIIVSLSCPRKKTSNKKSKICLCYVGIIFYKNWLLRAVARRFVFWFECMYWTAHTYTLIALPLSLILREISLFLL